MNPAEDDVRTSLPRETPHGVTTQRVAGVDSNAHNIAGRDALGK